MITNYVYTQVPIRVHNKHIESWVGEIELRNLWFCRRHDDIPVTSFSIIISPFPNELAVVTATQY